MENAWWSRLRQNGLMISPTVLQEILPEGPEELDEFKYEKLRDAYTVYNALQRDDSGKLKNEEGRRKWLDAIFESLLGYDGSWWQKEQHVSRRFKTESITKDMLRPNRVLLFNKYEEYPRFLLKIDKDSKRIGMGRGRTVYGKLLELLRGTGNRIGIITNGDQIRLVYAGLDHDSWVDWEVERWFEDAEGKEELLGFISLYGHTRTDRIEGDDYPLLSMILRSREKQGELSQVLGEQTREAVETLLKAVDRASRAKPELIDVLRINPETGSEISESDRLDAIYQSSIRFVMRVVITLFAESRELLPKSNEAYHGSYGVEGLFAQLNQAAAAEGMESLEDRYYAWPRLLSLFRLIHEGSSYSELPIHEYGGALFRRGDIKSSDNVSRALSIFEDESAEISDATVLRMLKLLKIGKLKAKRGRSSTWVSGVVDFSDLRTEYIGMMYEGLLDYNLRMVTEDQEAVLFLNIGQEPALPFSLLKNLDEKGIKDLIGKLSKEKSSDLDIPDIESEEELIDQIEEESEEEVEEETPDIQLTPQQEKYIEILEWAENAVQLAGLVKKSKGKKFNKFRYEKDVYNAAVKLIKRDIYPDQMYLVRASGTRKGTGTFYTKPGLAVPTVHRTLEPLAYHVEGDGGDRKLTPKKPEEILALKVCDPAMGSGSFLVAALRYLTDALYESLWYHVYTKENGSITTTIPEGEISKALFHEDITRYRPDDEKFEEKTKARLKRYVVERCIYGVDINPLAVELAKLSLWVETLDRELPFEFLEHKLKLGNSLVGTWFDQFQDYPIMAWMREGGDKDHKGVHYEKGDWTKRIKETLNKKVKPELVRIIQGVTTVDEFYEKKDRAVELHERAFALFEEMHNLPLFGEGFQEREEFFRERIKNDPGFIKLKETFDLWCAIWFWPGDWIDEDTPTPNIYYKPTEKVLERTRDLARKHKFFHWELEFPDVFVSGIGGFDSVIGNPPWEISKPNSKEYFTRYDPIYRTYGKQIALTHQKELFEKQELIERNWLLNKIYFKSLSNWTKNTAFPYGDPSDELIGGVGLTLAKGKKNKTIHDIWRNKRYKRKGFSDSQHPFRYQGSADINLYKMFLEMSFSITKERGRNGLILPSSVHNDYGSYNLRKKWLPSLDLLVKFDNEKRIFNGLEHNSKFDIIIFNSSTENHTPEIAFFSWSDTTPLENIDEYTISINNDYIKKVSPSSWSVPELRNEIDKKIISKLYSNGILMPKKWQIFSEFHMTNDSNLFKKIGELPLYQGGMIWLFDHRYNYYDENNKKYVRGKLEDVDFRWHYPLIPKKWILIKDYRNKFKDRIINGKWHYEYYRIVFRVQSSRSNQRTFIATLIPPYCSTGNSLGILLNPNYEESILLLSFLCSFIHDFNVRTKVTSNINFFYFPQFVIPKINLNSEIAHTLIKNSLKLICTSKIFKPLFENISNNYLNEKDADWNCNSFAITNHERKRLNAINDALFFYLFGLDEYETYYILSTFKGVDQKVDRELRQTTITAAAFHDLNKLGVSNFCKLNNGDGWMVPNRINYNIDKNGSIVFNTSENISKTVREKLGPRFLDWQLNNTLNENWRLSEESVEKIIRQENIKFQKNILKDKSNKSKIKGKSLLDF